MWKKKTILQNHKITELQNHQSCMRLSRDQSGPNLCSSRVTCCRWSVSRHVLNMSEDGDITIFPGYLFQCLSMATVKKDFFVCSACAHCLTGRHWEETVFHRFIPSCKIRFLWDTSSRGWTVPVLSSSFFILKIFLWNKIFLLEGSNPFIIFMVLIWSQFSKLIYL